MTAMEPDAQSRELRRTVDRLEEELAQQRQTIDSLQHTVKLLQDFAGAVNAERANQGVIRKRLRRLRTPALELHEQHPPRPLRVPRRYLRVSPPDPAPRISIVTPSYNQGSFVERSIRSVTNQGYPNLEYVVQDGGSTDETTQILARYAGRLARAVSAPDDGQADAINRGFAGTTGEIMAYLNSDDLLLPGSLAYVAAYFVRHPDVDAVYGHRVVVDAIDREIGIWALPRHRDWVVTIADFIPQETLFWRRRLWDRAGARVDAKLQFALDWDLLLRFVAADAKIVRLPRFLGAFRTHPLQKTLANTDVGVGEAAFLRDRWHGYKMSHLEVHDRLRPFYRRHIAAHILWRLREFIPKRRLHCLTATPLADRPQLSPAPGRDRELGAHTERDPAPAARQAG
jgi:glycosyltransferase involved in cell wall biosynthesis